MNISIAVDAPGWRALGDVEALVERAVAVALAERCCAVDVLLTSDAQVRKLNHAFRRKDKTTNVLSFPSPVLPVPEGELPHLGNIVLAYETVKREASKAQKAIADHMTHLIVHATLHLQGYDHDTEKDADVMEQKERDILASLGIADPYAA